MARYNINGTEYPSVTEVIDQLKQEWAMPWVAMLTAKSLLEKYNEKVTQKQTINITELCAEAKDAYKQKSNEALNIGSQLHEVIEQYIKIGKDVKDVPEAVQNGFLAFLELEQDKKVTWYETEKVVFDEDLCYAGTLDAVANIDNKLYIIDFKSSKQINPEYFIQLCAYKQAYEKMNNVIIEGLGILRLDKETGIPEWKDYSQEKDYISKVERQTRAFNCLLDFYYLCKDRRLKNNWRAEELKQKKITMVG